MKYRAGHIATNLSNVGGCAPSNTSGRHHLRSPLGFEETEILHFMRGAHRFEIHRWETESGVGYVGFYDGKPSVAARERHVVAKLLLSRHSR